jgi:NifU-like protein involved in Fe-S cluster formation
MDYPEAIARHFERPANVGPLSGEHVRRGEAGSMAQGAWVVIEAEVRDGRLARLGFRAFGCPYLIAACSHTTEILANRPVAALGELDAGTLALALAIPARKLGSLLVLEDALRNCRADWDTTPPAGRP